MAANNEILVEVENVSKRFCKDFKRSIRYGFMDALRALAGRDLDTETLRKDEFWAVKDVSFQLRRGECLGLIGHNGAGKSTLLKMLNGLIRPDHGKITMRGRIGALIELGTGFNPILTGRENIYNNAAVLGFSKEETEKKFDEIVAFSEIGDFLDMPVQNYSSGMKVRLGFAVAAQLEPDILLIDEVLAVGDMSFAMKSFNAITRILQNSAVIFVSHSMPFVSRICDSTILMNKGKIEVKTENVGLGIQSYFDAQKLAGALDFGDDIIMLNDVKILSENSNDDGYLEYGRKLRFEINLKSVEKLRSVRVAILIYNMAQINVALLESNLIEIDEGSKQSFTFDFGESFLSISKYFITVRFDQYGEKSVRVISNYVNYKSFQVVGTERLVFAPFYKKQL